MENIKFRAIIENFDREIDLNHRTKPFITVYFTLKDLVNNNGQLFNKCPYTYNLLISWLQNNDPDRYTGFLDKNGTEIYENDVCYNNLNGKRGVVKYVGGCVSICGTLLGTVDRSNIEVTGNVKEDLATLSPFLIEEILTNKKLLK